VRLVCADLALFSVCCAVLIRAMMRGDMRVLEPECQKWRVKRSGVKCRDRSVREVADWCDAGFHDAGTKDTGLPTLTHSPSLFAHNQEKE
jgi:hypothetical protein